MFLDAGYERTSLPAVAEAAGVSVATVKGRGRNAAALIAFDVDCW